LPLYVIATDGHPLSRPRSISRFLGPSDRIDAIAIGPPAGKYSMGTLPFKNMAWHDPFPAQQVATSPLGGPHPVMLYLRSCASICDAPMDRRGLGEHNRTPAAARIFTDR
jgi:hypothetical protein